MGTNNYYHGWQYRNIKHDERLRKPSMYYRDKPRQEHLHS